MIGEGMGVLLGTGNPGLDQHVSVFSLVLQVCAPFCVVRPPEVKNKTLAPSLYLSVSGFAFAEWGQCQGLPGCAQGLRNCHTPRLCMPWLPYPTANIGHTSVWHSG